MRVLAAAVAGLTAVSAPAVVRAQQTQATTTPTVNPAASTALAPVDPASLAVARQIIEIMFPAATRADQFAAPMTAISAQLRETMMAKIPLSGLQPIVDEYLDSLVPRLRPVTERHIPSLLEAMAQAYAREFQTEELRNILGFAQTPAGMHYLRRSSALIADPAVAKANRDYFADAQEVMTAMQAELEVKVRAYAAKHPRPAVH